MEFDVGFTLIWLDHRQSIPGIIFEPNRLFHTLETFKFLDGVFYHVACPAIDEVTHQTSQEEAPTSGQQMAIKIGLQSVRWCDR